MPALSSNEGQFTGHPYLYFSMFTEPNDSNYRGRYLLVVDRVLQTS